MITINFEQPSVWNINLPKRQHGPWQQYEKRCNQQWIFCANFVIKAVEKQWYQHYPKRKSRNYPGYLRKTELNFTIKILKIKMRIE